jgi:hypothetical protein
VVRRIALAVAMLLMCSACAGGPDGAAESQPSFTTPTIHELPVETTASISSTTSTSAGTTTTTVGPWTTLPPPACPSAGLAAELGGPLTVESMCLEVTTGEQLPPSEEVAGGLADVLGLLGIDVVAEGCQATFRLTASGRRTSELYSVGQTTMRCGTGLVLSGEASLVIDGVVRRTWTADVNNPPPATTESCPDEAARLSGDEWDDELVTVPLVEMFGEVAGYAEWVGFVPAHIGIDDRPAPTADEVQWLACWLTAGKAAPMARLERLAQVEGNEAALLPLTPYLISLLDSAQDCASCSSAADFEEAESMALRLNFVLGQILGIVMPNAAPAGDFWRFWEQRQSG